MSKILIKNRKAYHDYEILEKFEAGLQLLGTEVKSLREHHASITEAYVQIKKGEIFLVGATINPYSHGNVHNHEERRDRKLLMHKKEIEKLKKQTQEKGMAILPLAIYLKKNHIKLEIGIGRGKKAYDKREALKKKQHTRDIARELKKNR